MDSQPVPPTDSNLRFDTTPYQPDGGFTSGGAGLLIGLELAGGLVLGAVAGFIAQWIYLILVFPIFIGLGLGAIGVFAVKAGKVRSPGLGGVAGFFGGCVAMFTLQYVEYRHFLAELDKIQPGMSQNWEKDKGFYGFIDFEATLGVEIQRAAGGGGKGLNLGYVGTYIYWGVELLIVAGIALGMVYSQSRQPYCTRCDGWKDRRILGTLKLPDGVTDPAPVAALVADGQVGQLSAWGPALEGGELQLSAAECLNCAGDVPIDVKLEHVTKSGDVVVNKELVHVTYPPEALQAFGPLFLPPPIEPDEPAEEAG